jgi:glycosyltransferase involved in cell wall biosynthesis
MKYFAASPFFRRIRRIPALFYPLSTAAVAVMAAHRLVQIVTRAPLADIVFLQRNLLPVHVFPALEWLASRLAGRTVFDFDDAIFTDRRRPEVLHRDIPRILGFADAVVCGNGFLADYARRRSADVTVIPTVPPAVLPAPRPERRGPVLIGWIGTAANIPYLRTVEGALLRLAGRCGANLLTVSDEPLRMPPGIRHEHRPWSLGEEERFFREIDIGIMPLPDDAWTRGKCAFKALEYLAHGLPAVVSPVGANRELGPEGNGVYFASTEAEWEEKLSLLCGSLALRSECGRRGKELADSRYSPAAAAAIYQELFSRLRFGVDLRGWLGPGGVPVGRPADGGDLPVISVVVPSFQQGRFLERTLLSILRQGYPKTEIIVIDGGSTDGTVGILERYRDRIAFWCSERDAGQADALNKGLERATGDIVGWQNSDDLYLPGAFSAAAAAFREDPALDLLHGNILVIDAEDRPLEEWRYVPLHRQALARQWNLLSNQSVFWRRRSPRIGRFDPSFRFCMDYDFFERAVSAGARTRFTPALLGAVRMHAETKTSRIRQAGAEEELRVRSRHPPAGPLRRRAALAWLRLRRIAWHIRQGEVRYLLNRRLLRERR